MALSFRHRVGLALVAGIATAPLWAAAGAVAATQTVTFSGKPLLNVGAVSCPSRPSVSQLTVSPGTKVNFANRLGEAATLWAGDSHKHLSNGEMVPVTFTSGPATIVMQMLPDCSLDLGTHDQMRVVVTAPTSGGGSGSGGSGSGGHGVVSTPTANEPTAPDHLATPKPSRTKPSREAEPTPSAPAGLAGDASSDPTSTDGSGNDDPFKAPAAADDTAQNVTLGEPVGDTSSTHGASGLLTLIATVSVVGVSAAAIRAIIAQRAARAIAA
jgi:hypothetical protein